jgi:hypothetical protein
MKSWVLQETLHKVLFFLCHNINNKFLSLAVTNIHQRICMMHNMNNLIPTKFSLYTRIQEVEYIIT